MELIQGKSGTKLIPFSHNWYKDINYKESQNLLNWEMTLIGFIKEKHITNYLQKMK